ncbi:MAG: TIGR01777 family oxidoreductase [Deltaproteobacteria bacterium]|nr:TIGR01777 family oxidoreductase [Deltaproteobacteria bacterium]
MPVFVHRTHIDAPADEVFAWHGRPGALERLIAPWERIRLLSRTGGIENGARAILELRVGPRRMRWIAEHRDYEEGRRFRDVQIEGPFARWDHLHRVEPEGTSACTLEDRIEYELPGGALGEVIGARFVRRNLERTFAYRHRIIALDVRAHLSARGARGDAPPVTVLVSGAHGFIGSALVPFLTAGGHRVIRLVRRPVQSGGDEVHWDPEAGTIDKASLAGVDAAVHLAGESIASGRWTEDLKQRILRSREKGTRLLSETLARLEPRPRVLLSASAIGYYGNRGDEELREESPFGDGFLAGVCREWEAGTATAEEAGIRVAHLRFGVVLNPAGGALRRMLPPFRAGCGGKLGSGTQYMSWVAREDAIGAAHHVLVNRELEGPVNVVAPEPVTNAEFTRTLAKLLRRPAFLGVPAAALRLALGEMADETLLASARVAPARLGRTGYAFREPVLEQALAHMLGL